jgi:S-adenosylmethionine-diacylglycerol 3-amino-3-carboxypropyl transferase
MQAVRRATIEGLDTAVHQNKALSKAGLLERLFTFAFRGLVYPQIWEDPVVDMAALAIKPDDHVVAITSGGCNVLSYLTADPAKISAVDLNGAHIALGRLKLCALTNLPDYAAFFRFFGQPDEAANLDAYRQYLLPHLDAATAGYWNARRPFLKRRISAFSRNFYHYGLLGKFIGFGHLIGRLAGCRPEAVLAATSLDEQRAIFDAKIAPFFDSRLAQWLSRQPATLFGLGIPPSQYKKLSADLPGGIVAVLRHRLERLACGFDVNANYFAWQAFARRYPADNQAALPPYLQRAAFDVIRDRADRVSLRQASMTDFLRAQPAASVDCVVLLDAQDWMSDVDLTALWTEITRTARDGARVIFRTAADERLLPGRIPNDLLGAWTYDEAECRALGDRDRSSIYGAFHLYRLAARVAPVPGAVA